MKKEEVYIREVIDHLVDFYKLDLSTYNKAYRIWFDTNLHGEIVLDFLRKTNVPAKIRIISTNTRTAEKPDRTGFITLDKNNPLFFLSKKFKETRFEICIDNSAYADFDFFICTLIHELAHLVLYSTLNKYRDSEIATDLFVMVFGLHEEVLRMSLTSTRSIGYITNEQIEYAHKYIIEKSNNKNKKIQPQKNYLKLFIDKIF